METASPELNGEERSSCCAAQLSPPPDLPLTPLL